MNYQFRQINPLFLLMGIAFFILLMCGLFFVAQGVFLILMYLAPVLLVATLLLDYKVILNYGNWMIKKYNKSILSGVTWTLVTLFGFPILSAILCFRAYASYKLKQASEQDEEQQEGEYIDYEIVEEEEQEFIHIPESFKKR